MRKSGRKLGKLRCLIEISKLTKYKTGFEARKLIFHVGAAFSRQ
jgi:hypothetical protein